MSTKYADVEVLSDISDNDRNKKISTNEENNRYREEIESLARNSGSNVLHFLENLQRYLSEKETKTIRNNNLIYRTVLNEFYEFKQYHIGIHNAKLHANLSQVDMTAVDDRGRLHILQVGVDFSRSSGFFYAKNFDLPDFNVLPEKVRSVASSTSGPRGRFGYNFPNENSLISMYDNFSAVVNSIQMQKYLDLMDEIDTNCWVLDPECPTRKDTFRRLALEVNVSLNITFNSLDVSSMPKLQFLGPLNQTNVYEEKLNENLALWDPIGREPLENILFLLGL